MKERQPSRQLHHTDSVEDSHTGTTPRDHRLSVDPQSERSTINAKENSQNIVRPKLPAQSKSESSGIKSKPREKSQGKPIDVPKSRDISQQRTDSSSEVYDPGGSKPEEKSHPDHSTSQAIAKPNESHSSITSPSTLERQNLDPYVVSTFQPIPAEKGSINQQTFTPASPVEASANQLDLNLQGPGDASDDVESGTPSQPPSGQQRRERQTRAEQSPPRFALTETRQGSDEEGPSSQTQGAQSMVVRSNQPDSRLCELVKG